MSESLAKPQVTPAVPTPGSGKLRTLLGILPYLVLYAIAIWLVALTDGNENPLLIKTYWQWFIPVIGVIALIGGWQGLTAEAEGRRPYIIKQILHWLTTLAVVHLLFGPTLQAFLTTETHGFMVIYVLGLSAILAGIHLDWKMGLFGLFLIGSGIGIAFLDDNAMLVTIIGLALMGILLSVVILRRIRT